MTQLKRCHHRQRARHFICLDGSRIRKAGHAAYNNLSAVALAEVDSWYSCLFAVESLICDFGLGSAGASPALSGALAGESQTATLRVSEVNENSPQLAKAFGPGETLPSITVPAGGYFSFSFAFS